MEPRFTSVALVSTVAFLISALTQTRHALLHLFLVCAAWLSTMVALLLLYVRSTPAGGAPLAPVGAAAPLAPVGGAAPGAPVGGAVPGAPVGGAAPGAPAGGGAAIIAEWHALRGVHLCCIMTGLLLVADIVAILTYWHSAHSYFTAVALGFAVLALITLVVTGDGDTAAGIV